MFCLGILCNKICTSFMRFNLNSCSKIINKIRKNMIEKKKNDVQEHVLLAAVIKALWYLNVINGSGKFLKNSFKALVIVLVSHSIQSSRKLSEFNPFVVFRRSIPIAKSLVILELTPPTLYSPCSSKPINNNRSY